MPVIAMTRELGSLGREIAEGLAGDLNLKLVKHEIVDRLSRRTRLPASAVLRCVEGKATLLERWRADLDGLSLYAAEEIFDLAAAGDVVIRGWGATHLLRSVPHVLCVRVCAPLELRALRVMEMFGLDDVALARDAVRRSDAACNAAMRRRFGASWEQSARHDLVLNTEHTGPERCIAQIKRALEFSEYQPTADSRARLRALALTARARSALWRDPATAEYPISVETDTEGHPGHLTLRGFVVDEDQKRAAADLVARSEGVHAVSNRLRAMCPRLFSRPHDL